MKLTVSRMRDLDKQVTNEEISYSRMVELINEPFIDHLSALQKELAEKERDLQIEKDRYSELVRNIQLLIEIIKTDKHPNNIKNN